MIRVYLASPYRGDGTVSRDVLVAYARRCLRDSLDRGEASFAPHLLYTQVLEDSRVGDRRKALRANRSWLQVMQRLVSYEDYGISSGMRDEINLAERWAIEIRHRRIGR